MSEAKRIAYNAWDRVRPWASTGRGRSSLPVGRSKRCKRTRTEEASLLLKRRPALAHPYHCLVVLPDHAHPAGGVGHLYAYQHVTEDLVIGRNRSWRALRWAALRRDRGAPAICWTASPARRGYTTATRQRNGRCSMPRTAWSSLMGSAGAQRAGAGGGPQPERPDALGRTGPASLFGRPSLR